MYHDSVDVGKTAMLQSPVFHGNTCTLATTGHVGIARSMISMSERRDFQQMRTAGVLLALLCSTRADSRPFTVGAGSPCIRKGDGIEDCKETFIETETIKVLEEETSVIDIGGGEEVQTRLTVDEGLTSDDSLAAENIAKVLGKVL